MEQNNINKRQLFMTEKVEILTLSELKQTVNAMDIGQKTSKTRPVAHFQLIDDIVKILTEAGHEPVIDHIYCAKSSGTKIIPKIEEQYGIEKVIDAWIIDKVTGKIKIPKLSNEEVECCIAFAYHDKGIDIAFGTDVRDCKNMCIYGKDIMHTYGAKKDVSYERMMQVLKEWSTKFVAMFQANIRIAQKMKEIKVTGFEMLQFIGKLSVLAIKNNMGLKVIAPLNLSQIHDVVRGIITKKGEKFYEGPDCTLWEFYNFMTYVKKGNTSDITTLLPDIADIGNMIIDEYKIITEVEDHKLSDLTEDDI